MGSLVAGFAEQAPGQPAAARHYRNLRDGPGDSPVRIRQVPPITRGVIG
jgi:hypothetical protein